MPRLLPEEITELATGKSVKPQKKEFDKDAEHLEKVIRMFVEKHGKNVEIPEEALPEGVEFPQYAAGTAMKFLRTILEKDAWKTKTDVMNDDLNYIG